MATILVVDDDPPSRDLLASLLGYRHHRVLVAGDGQAALEIARADPPDLVITDVLMPTMDGYDLVRHLREEPRLNATRVMFYSAHYVEREARSLAASCGVDRVLTKPIEPEDFLQHVDAVLEAAPARSLIGESAAFDREHRRLLTDKLAEKATQLTQVNARLSEVVAISQRLGLERDAVRLVDEFASASRRIIGCRHSLVAITGDDGRFLHAFGSGLDNAVAQSLLDRDPADGRLGRLFDQPEPLHLRGCGQDVGLPPGHPPIETLLAVPIVSLERTYGWVCLSNKVGLEDFTHDDEELAAILAAQLGRIYENGLLYLDLERQGRIATALAGVGRELIGLSTTPAVLGRLCSVLTEALPCDGCQALVWDRERRVLVPTASDGHAPEDWQRIQSVAIPEVILGNALRTLEQGELAEVSPNEARSDEGAILRRRFGVARALLVPLRREGKVIGLLNAFLVTPGEDFDAGARPIASGVAQLASLALENAWLVEQLGAANRVKSEFVATMSHELRTPLHVILGYNELLSEEQFGPISPEQREALGRVQRSAVALLQLINATLDVGRLEMGQLPIRSERVALAELCSEIEGESRELWSKPAVTLRFELPGELPPLSTDRSKLASILKNLIDNAVKFTDKGEVRVSACKEDGGVRIDVADTGPGIPEYARDFIFDPFRQADSSDARPHGGVGLGLYIVRSFAEALGGHVAVDSEIDEGSTFHVWLPA